MWKGKTKARGIWEHNYLQYSYQSNAILNGNYINIFSWSMINGALLSRVQPHMKLFLFMQFSKALPYVSTIPDYPNVQKWSTETACKRHHILVPFQSPVCTLGLMVQSPNQASPRLLYGLQRTNKPVHLVPQGVPPTAEGGGRGRQDPSSLSYQFCSSLLSLCLTMGNHTPATLPNRHILMCAIIQEGSLPSPPQD